MIECRLVSDSDLGWALERVREGQAVRVTVPEPMGTAAYRSQQMNLANRRLMTAGVVAEVSEVEYRLYRRWRRREHRLVQFVLSPKSPDDPAGVREPRVPVRPLPALTVEVPGGR